MGQGLLTWGSPAVEDMDVHEVLQILLQGLPVQPRQAVGALDTLCLPVCPIDALPIEGQPKGVRELASNQHLPRTQHVCHPPARSSAVAKSLRPGVRMQLGHYCLLCDLEQELVINSLWPWSANL